jgi:predicted nucleotide-binding protein
MTDLLNVLKNIVSQLEPYSMVPEEYELMFSKISDAATVVANSSSGSWLGYQANVYYANFQTPPYGTFFNVEWGFSRSQDDWREYSYQDVQQHIENLSRTTLKSIGDKIERDMSLNLNPFERSKERVISILSLLKTPLSDSYIEEQFDAIKRIQLKTPQQISLSYMPKGQIISRDDRAMQSGGLSPPPHIQILVKIDSFRQLYFCCSSLKKHINNIIEHIELAQEQGLNMNSTIGNKVFIGHGHSEVWKELRDFIRDRLHLEWEEYSRIMTAGQSRKERLSNMLNSSCFAFLIMTAEDENPNGELQARMNVIHEVGLFQGRLGFEKAIILLEKDCQEFSNISGLDYIPFDKDNIVAIYEKIREVLEREGILSNAQ